MITKDWLLQYSRQILLPEVGVEGQKKLQEAKVCVVGVGGLGCPVSVYLASSGVGTLGLVDPDRVNLSNLQRQPLYGYDDVGYYKVSVAERKLRDLRKDLTVHTYPEALNKDNALKILKSYDLVLDCSDNFPTRYLVNDACFFLKKPYVFGAVFQFQGQVALFNSHHGACYRCLFEKPPPPHKVPSCIEGGILGAVVGSVGTLQAVEALKWFLGLETLTSQLLIMDFKAQSYRKIHLPKNPHCALCSSHATITNFVDYEAFCGLASSEEEILPKQLLEAPENYTLVDIRSPLERQALPLGEGLVVPQGELKELLSTLAQKGNVVLVCQGGFRSRQQALELRREGFQGVYSLKGGAVGLLLEKEGRG